MEILDLKGSQEFSADRHVCKFQAETPFCSIKRTIPWDQDMSPLPIARCRHRRQSPGL